MKRKSALGFSSTERQRLALEFITQNQRVTVEQLCEQFQVSLATARRDLNELAGSGMIERVHGGAIAMHRLPPEPPVLRRAAAQNDEKIRIGMAAAELVQDGETVFLGSGTTVFEAARRLHERKGLTIITNSLMVMNEFAETPEVTVISLGGMLRHSELSVIGHLTEKSLAELRADRVIMGIRAIHPRHGLTNEFLPETMTDRAIVEIGRQVIVVADHTKCGLVSTASVAPVTEVDMLITDKATPADFVEAMQQQGVQVLVV